MTKHQTTEVVVIGGGYAGVLAANHLRLNADVAVTLINPRRQFVERIRLHQLITGSDDAVVDYAEVLSADVRLLIGTAVRIDAAARTVTLRSGCDTPRRSARPNDTPRRSARPSDTPRRSARPNDTPRRSARPNDVGYDYLVYAVGSTGAAPTVPGAAEFAHQVSEYEHAESLRAALAEVHPSAPVVVVGAGPTGIETAAELSEQRGRVGGTAGSRTVTLVCGDVLGPYFSASARRSVAKRMRTLGVTVLEGAGAKVVEVRANSVLLADGRELAAAVTIWTAGFGAPDLAARSGLATDGVGRLLTDETLTSVDDPFIVAAGDASAPSDLPLRMSCQAAIPLGAQAANTVLSRIAGAEPAPVNQAFTGQCVSLGRHAGVIQLAHLDDRVLGLHLGGRTAASIKEAVCRGTVAFLAREARRPGSYFWLKGGKRAKHLAAVR